MGVGIEREFRTDASEKGVALRRIAERVVEAGVGLINRISLLQLEARRFNGSPEVHCLLLVETILLSSSERIGRVCEEILNEYGEHSKPFDRPLIIHPSQFWNITEKYGNDALKFSLTTLYAKKNSSFN